MLPILNRCLHLHSLLLFCTILSYSLLIIKILISWDLFFFYPSKLVIGFTYIMNFEHKFIILYSVSSIPLNLFIEVIISITHNIYHYFCDLFISFHPEFSFLVKVSLLIVLHLCGSLHQ
jgi:hypothetical protein